MMVSTHRTDDLARDYQTRGYVIERSVFTEAEIAELRAESDRLRSDPKYINERNLRASTREVITEGRVVDRLDPIIDISSPFNDLAKDARITDRVARVFSEPGYLMKDKLIWKCPGAHGYRCHQDYTGWVELPAPPTAMLSVLVALDASNEENGPLELYPSRHGRYYLEECTPTDVLAPSAGLVPDDELKQWDPPEVVSLNAGDIVIFSSLAPHQSRPNNTSAYRRHVYLTYSSASHGDLYEQYYSLYRSYLSSDRQRGGMVDIYYE